MIAGSLVASSGNGTPVALLLCGGSLITALTVWFVRETSRTSLGDEPTPELPTTPHHTEEITA